MNKKTLSTITFISSLVILLFSILGLIILNLNYLIVSGEIYLSGFHYPQYATIYFSGYNLIFGDNSIEFVIEPLLHFIGFILFFAGSLIFTIFSIINYFTKDESKKIGIKSLNSNGKKKTYKTISIILSIILGLIAILFMVFGCLALYGGSISITYRIGLAKIFNAFLLGFNFLILAFAIDAFLYNLGSNSSNK